MLLSAPPSPTPTVPIEGTGRGTPKPNRYLVEAQTKCDRVLLPSASLSKRHCCLFWASSSSSSSFSPRSASQESLKVVWIGCPIRALESDHQPFRSSLPPNFLPPLGSSNNRDCNDDAVGDRAMQLHQHQELSKFPPPPPPVASVRIIIRVGCYGEPKAMGV